MDFSAGIKMRCLSLKSKNLFSYYLPFTVNKLKLITVKSDMKLNHFSLKFSLISAFIFNPFGARGWHLPINVFRSDRL